MSVYFCWSFSVSVRCFSCFSGFFNLPLKHDELFPVPVMRRTRLVFPLAVCCHGRLGEEGKEIGRKIGKGEEICFTIKLKNVLR